MKDSNRRRRSCSGELTINDRNTSYWESDAPRIGPSEVERLVCNAEAFGSIDALQPRNADAWELELPPLSALPHGGQPERKLRVCIATEEITGPIRNGGIGTTYAYLAETLAKAGCDVTILYLRGRDVENGVIDDWVAHYWKRGVKLVPAPDFAAQDRFHAGADRWLKSPYIMLRYLLDHPMDVVHVSEWHGSGYLCLLAKRQGLAFRQTLFVVKASSPWLWNRIYGAQPLDRLEDLAKITAERQSVELADMVIGGSLHLLRWMASQGYRIPRERTFVQPNLVTFDHLRDLMSRRRDAAGTHLAFDEIVFFGRLEARKGLFVFCQAIRRLIRLGVALPRTITFMGKPGARLTARPDQDILGYINSETSAWPCEIKVLTRFQQYEALEYLLAGPRLAVMPSIIENSSMAVYEAAICGIPFIASQVGGTPELIAREDHEKVLCEPHPIPLANRLEQSLRQGAYIARPSFSNDENIKAWENFHRELGCGLIDELLARCAPPPVESNGAAFSVCIYHTGDDGALRATLESLRAQQHPPLEAIIAVDADEIDAFDRAKSLLQEFGLKGCVLEAFDYDFGPAFNKAADHAQGEFALFVLSGVTLRANALRALARVAGSTAVDLVNFFYRVTKKNPSEPDFLQATILGSLSESFFRMDLTAMPLAVRLSSFRSIDGFSSDYRILGGELELVARAQVKGLRCTTALMELATVPDFEESWLSGRGYDRRMSYFRVIRPQMSAAPLALRELLMMARGLQLKEAGKRAGRAPVAGAQTLKKKLLAWLLPAREFSQTEGSRATAARPGLGDRLLEPTEAIDVAIPGAVRDHKDMKPATAARHMLYLLPGSTQEARYTGRLFGLRDGVLYGWVHDELHPGEHVSISVYENGQRVKQVVANSDLATAAPLSRDMPGHGFAIRVGPNFGLFRPSDIKQIRLRVGREDEVALGEAALGFRSLADAGFDGCCDSSEQGLLHGWVWRKGAPDEAVDVVVFVDGRVLTRLTASSSRQDLASAGIGRGDHAFRLQMPRTLRDGSKHRITVLTADTGLPLNFGKLMLQGDRITPV